MKKDYKKEYESLRKKFKELERDYIKVSNELYNIQVSRTYKVSQGIRVITSPAFRAARFIKRKLKETNRKSKKLNSFIKNAEKIAVVPCSFEFDEFVNQRPINYAKYMANNGYKVIYVAWQWNKDNIINNAYEEVYKNIIQIPLYDFLEYKSDWGSAKKKIFFINFPNKVFCDLLYNLRAEGFFIHYDIMDEWEEFQKVGQADWYDKIIEEKIVIESDYITAVSPYLIEKFNYLRSDIELSPNGFYKKVTGYKNQNISLKEIVDNKIHLGYFGHLTSSWFDWDLLIDVAKNNKNFIFHIIGYGIPEKIEKTIEKMDNINFYGKIPTSELYKYVMKWNIGIIPFKESDLSKAVDPIKIYEYLYMGLPVIVSGIEHLKSYPKTFVIQDRKEFEKCVKNIVDKKNKEDIADYIESCTWEARFSKYTKHYEEEGFSGFYE